MRPTRRRLFLHWVLPISGIGVLRWVVYCHWQCTWEDNQSINHESVATSILESLGVGFFFALLMNMLRWMILSFSERKQP